MSKREVTRPADLVNPIVSSTERLANLHVDLLQSELRQTAREIGPALVSVGAGAGLVATSGLLGSLMLVHGLHRATRLPLWGCFGLVGATLGTIGAGLVLTGTRRLSAVNVLPRETLATLGEDLAWVREQTRTKR